MQKPGGSLTERAVKRPDHRDRRAGEIRTSSRRLFEAQKAQCRLTGPHGKMEPLSGTPLEGPSTHFACSGRHQEQSFEIAPERFSQKAPRQLAPESAKAACAQRYQSGRPEGRLTKPETRTTLYGRSSWATCTAFRAAPLRIWSATSQKARPWGTVGSLRKRPTKVPSVPASRPGMG